MQLREYVIVYVSVHTSVDLYVHLQHLIKSGAFIYTFVQFT